ncbi:MAG TPA: rhodanese-like domain-containing protein [Planctomycetota bacterium]|nr:rhodanese-like domain-containing protein [Planctomycetota bacterium]
MELAALVVAVLALVVAFVAISKASSFAGRIEEVELAARRRAENLTEATEEALKTQRELLAQFAGGAKLTREMILDGRLWHDVDGARAAELVSAGARVLDVRSPAETSSGVIPGALLVPIDALEARVRELPKDERGWVVYCSAGGRSAAACEFLSHAGHAGLHNLSGGIGAWNGKLVRPS